MIFDQIMSKILSKIDEANVISNLKPLILNLDHKSIFWPWNELNPDWEVINARSALRKWIISKSTINSPLFVMKWSSLPCQCSSQSLITSLHLHDSLLHSPPIIFRHDHDDLHNDHDHNHHDLKNHHDNHHAVPGTSLPTCEARSWGRQSQPPFCCKSIHRHCFFFVSFCFFFIKIFNLGARACSHVRSSSPSVFRSA